MRTVTKIIVLCCVLMLCGCTGGEDVADSEVNSIPPRALKSVDIINDVSNGTKYEGTGAEILPQIMDDYLFGDRNVYDRNGDVISTVDGLDPIINDPEIIKSYCYGDLGREINYNLSVDGTEIDFSETTINDLMNLGWKFKDDKPASVVLYQDKGCDVRNPSLYISVLHNMDSGSYDYIDYDTAIEDIGCSQGVNVSESGNNEYADYDIFDINGLTFGSSIEDMFSVLGMPRWIEPYNNVIQFYYIGPEDTVITLAFNNEYDNVWKLVDVLVDRKYYEDLLITDYKSFEHK